MISFRAILALVCAVIFVPAGKSVRADVLFVDNVGTIFTPPSITKITWAGTTSVFSTANLDNPRGMLFDGNLDLYVASIGSQSIYKYAPAGGSALFATMTGQTTPTGIVRDSGGNVYVADFNQNQIIKFSSAGVDLGVFASSGLNGPEGLAIDAAGNIYAANIVDDTITKFTSAGTPSPFVTIGLDQPFGLAIAANGDLYISNQNADTIVFVPPTGGVPTFFANTASAPNGLAFDSAGNLYAAVNGANIVQKFTPSGTPSTFAATDLNGPIFIAIRSDDPPDPPPHCEFNNCKARQIKTSMVRAFTPCNEPGGNPSNTNTQAGIPACATPVALSAYNFKPQCKGSCNVQIKAAPKYCGAPAVPCCCITVVSKCAGILGPDTLPANGTFALSMVLRTTGDDSLGGDMTTINVPVSRAMSVVAGKTLYKSGCITLPTDAVIPSCASAEIVDLAILDPDGDRFAVPGVSCCGN